MRVAPCMPALLSGPRHFPPDFIADSESQQCRTAVGSAPPHVRADVRQAKQQTSNRHLDKPIGVPKRCNENGTSEQCIFVCQFIIRCMIEFASFCKVITKCVTQQCFEVVVLLCAIWTQSVDVLHEAGLRNPLTANARSSNARQTNHRIGTKRNRFSSLAFAAAFLIGLCIHDEMKCDQTHKALPQNLDFRKHLVDRVGNLPVSDVEISRD